MAGALCLEWLLGPGSGEGHRPGLLISPRLSLSAIVIALVEAIGIAVAIETAIAQAIAIDVAIEIVVRRLRSLW